MGNLGNDSKKKKVHKIDEQVSFAGCQIQSCLLGAAYGGGVAEVLNVRRNICRNILRARNKTGKMTEKKMIMYNDFPFYHPWKCAITPCCSKK